MFHMQIPLEYSGFKIFWLSWEKISLQPTSIQQVIWLCIKRAPSILEKTFDNCIMNIISCLPLLYLAAFPLKLLIIFRGATSATEKLSPTMTLFGITSYFVTWLPFPRTNCSLWSCSCVCLVCCQSGSCFLPVRVQCRSTDSPSNVPVIHSSPNSLVPSVAARAEVQPGLVPRAPGLRF